MFSRRRPAASEAESASTGCLTADGTSPAQDLDALRRRADDARAEVDKLRQDNERLQELVG